MSVVAEYTKAPGTAELDYGLDWASWLKPGESIVTSDWAITGGSSPADPADLVEVQDGIVNGTSTVLWATQGVVGVQYIAANTVTTNSVPARTDTRSIQIDVELR